MRQNRNRVRVLAVGIAFIFGACSQGDSEYTIVADQPGAFADSASSADPSLEPDESRDLNADSDLSGAESEPTTEPPSTEPPSSTSTTAPPQTTTAALSTTTAPSPEPPTTSKPPTTAQPTTEPPTTEPPSTTEPEPEAHLSPFCQQAEVFQSVLVEIEAQAEAGVSLGQAGRTEQLSIAVGVMVEISPVQHIAELAAMQATVADAATVLEEDGWQPVAVTSVFAELSQQFHLSDGPSSIGAVPYNQSVVMYWDLNCTR